jgi:hypothetical protein
MKNYLQSPHFKQNYLKPVITSSQASWVNMLPMLSPSWVILKNERCYKAFPFLIAGKLSNGLKTMLSPSWVTMLSRNLLKPYSRLSAGKLSNFAKNAQKKILVGKSANSLFAYIHNQKPCWEPDTPPYTMGVKTPHRFIWGVSVFGKNQKRITNQLCQKTFWSSG